MANNATFINKDGKEVERQRCLVYTRVMGYLRQVAAFNLGKKSEFYSRKNFTEQAATNSKFISDYPTIKSGNQSKNI